MNHTTDERNLIKLEISIEKLTFLFESGVICAAEIRCLTAHSKQQVSELCLRSCAKRLTCNALFTETSVAQPIYFNNYYNLSTKEC
jgi:hypothetical protein